MRARRSQPAIARRFPLRRYSSTRLADGALDPSEAPTNHKGTMSRLDARRTSLRRAYPPTATATGGPAACRAAPRHGLQRHQRAWCGEGLVWPGWASQAAYLRGWCALRSLVSSATRMPAARVPRGRRDRFPERLPRRAAPVARGSGPRARPVGSARGARPTPAGRPRFRPTMPSRCAWSGMGADPSERS